MEENPPQSEREQYIYDPRRACTHTHTHTKIWILFRERALFQTIRRTETISVLSLKPISAAVLCRRHSQITRARMHKEEKHYYEQQVNFNKILFIYVCVLCDQQNFVRHFSTCACVCRCRWIFINIINGSGWKKISDYKREKKIGTYK